MPRNRRVRTISNRPRRRRSGRKIAQVSSGIPITKKRVSGNPPVINEVSSQTVRVAFNISIKVSDKSSPFTVIIGDDPQKQNKIEVVTTNTEDILTFYLDLDEIFQAAYVRIFGQKPSDKSPNTIGTEVAMQSVTFYGPLGSGTIKMGVDFGPGMPGAIASDAGTLASRPVVRAVAPRLYWDRLHAVKAGDAAVGMWIYGFSPPGHHLGAGANTYVSQGRVDCVVAVRRSWYSANTAHGMAAKTYTELQMA